MNPSTSSRAPVPRFVQRDRLLLLGLTRRYAPGTNAGIPAQ